MTINSLEQIQRIDAENMLSHIDALPDQLASAWAHGQSLDLPAGAADVQQVVLSGMGGSAISADLLAALVADACPVPISVVRGYGLPAHVRGPETLVIALSHSGGTEETLSGAQAAAERGARLLAITSGGQLAPLAEGAGGAAWTFEYRAQPRATLGWLYGLLLAAFSRLGFAPDLAGDVQEAVEKMQRRRDDLSASTPAGENAAYRLAERLAGRIPVVWGAELLAPVARRWKTQLNENSKTVAYYEELPELNHNTVAGLQFPAGVGERISVVELVSSRYNHPRTQIRQQVTHDLLERAGIPATRVEAQGESRLAQQMTAIQFGDYVTFYLAMIYEVDPTPIDNIAWLKERLAGA